MNKIALILSMTFACIFLNVKVQAQNYLGKKINLEVTNQSTEATMFILEKLGGFNFSYDALQLDPGKLITIKGKHQSFNGSLRNVLNN